MNHKTGTTKILQIFTLLTTITFLACICMFKTSTNPTNSDPITFGNASSDTSFDTSPNASFDTSPNTSPNTSFDTSPNTSFDTSPNTSLDTSPNTSFFPQTSYYQEPFKHIKSNTLTHKITIVTGASDNHICTLKSLLYRMNRELDGLDVHIVVYDLGLSKSKKKAINRLFKLNYFSELRVFNFSAYPSFWDLRKKRGEYAWKVGMIAEVARDYPGTILVWLDSGSLVKRKFLLKVSSIMKNGFASPTSPGRMKEWTHPGVYKYFGDDHAKYDQLKNCNGASIAFDTKIRQDLIDSWYRCALNKDCIAPPGSSRNNHRQDQALLTYLAARYGLYCKKSRNTMWIVTHMDHACKGYNEVYEDQHDLELS